MKATILIITITLGLIMQATTTTFFTDLNNIPYFQDLFPPKTESDTLVYDGNSVHVAAPAFVLNRGELQVRVSGDARTVFDWTEEQHVESFYLLKAIASIWEEKGIDQFMIFGTESKSSESPFTWEAIPYEKTANMVARYWQQLTVLWPITFGADKDTLESQTEKTKVFSKKIPKKLTQQTERVGGAALGNDAFCRELVIDNQLVLEGKYFNVLYNYAPVGVGDEEKLHFLFVTKEHKRSIKELTVEEYLELQALRKFVFETLNKTRDIQNIYSFYKDGPDAGQTEDHFHEHFIATLSPTQDALGKGSLFPRMAFGATPLKGDDLERPVGKYKSEFESNLQK